MGVGGLDEEVLTQHYKLAYHCLPYFLEQNPNPIIVFDQIKTKRILRQENKFCLKHKLTINKANRGSVTHLSSTIINAVQGNPHIQTQNPLMCHKTPIKLVRHIFLNVI